MSAGSRDGGAGARAGAGPSNASVRGREGGGAPTHTQTQTQTHTNTPRHATIAPVDAASPHPQPGPSRARVVACAEVIDRRDGSAQLSPSLVRAAPGPLRLCPVTAHPDQLPCSSPPCSSPLLPPRPCPPLPGPPPLPLSPRRSASEVPHTARWVLFGRKRPPAHSGRTACRPASVHATPPHDAASLAGSRWGRTVWGRLGLGPGPARARPGPGLWCVGRCAAHLVRIEVLQHLLEVLLEEQLLPCEAVRRNVAVLPALVLRAAALPEGLGVDVRGRYRHIDV